MDLIFAKRFEVWLQAMLLQLVLIIAAAST